MVQHKTKDQIQQEALNISLALHRCTLQISMGVGKTYLGLQYIDHFYQKHPIKVLIVAPKKSIIQNWKDEAHKWGFSFLLDCIDFSTYLSIDKQHGEYDIIILDEVHNILNTHDQYLSEHKGRILGLTGTAPRWGNSEKGVMVSKYCPVAYKYSTTDAVDHKILNDYKIIVHKIDLDTSNNVQVKLKNMEFMTSELNNYKYWTQRIIDAQSPKQKQIASVMRMKAMMEYKSKEIYAGKLSSYISKDEKCILFCNTTEQADRLCPYTYHTKNGLSEIDLASFKEGRITRIACVLQISEGQNIPGLRHGIILHAYGNERKTAQRIGRLLRLNPDDTAIAHILCYRGSVDEKWIMEALKDFDQTKIEYIES